MAVLGTNHPTLLDLAKRTDPSGRIAALVEILNETNEVLQDMVWLEGNLPTGHRTSVVAGLPEPTWRRLYGGVQPSKGKTTQITDNTGMLEAYAEVDKALADLNGNTQAFRLSEDRLHIEGMNQEIAQKIFFGNELLLPESFTGLAPRFNSLSAGNADNIIDAGGAGVDNRSIWLVVWGPNTVHGIVPKGSTAGLRMEDKGQVTIENVDGLGGRMEAYRTHYRWDAGLTVRDWRYIVRIANIDFSDLTPDAASGANLPDLMFDAVERVPNIGLGRAAFYMSRGVRSFVRKQIAAGVSQATLTTTQVGGVMVVDFNGIPMRLVDQLNVDEALVA